MPTILFSDEDGNDITELVKLSNGRATPWHSSATFVYEHPVFGNVEIGYNTNGYITMSAGYVYKEVE